MSMTGCVKLAIIDSGVDKRCLEENVTLASAERIYVSQSGNEWVLCIEKSDSFEDYHGTKVMAAVSYHSQNAKIECYSFNVFDKGKASSYAVREALEKCLSIEGLEVIVISLSCDPYLKEEIENILEKLYGNVLKESVLENKSVEKITLEDFSFAYEDDPSNMIYEHTNCEFKKGNINLLYGASGEGKTTLFKILMRKCKEYQGKVHIDEEELNSYEKQDIMQVIGYLPQEDMVFRDSISANIKLGTDVTDKEMYEVCRKCEIDREIRQMEAGYDTLITTENINVSGGQVKRMMLSRLLLVNKEILLLDEPTASLDQKSSEKIMKALHEIAKEKLVIMITHDKNAKRYSDRIFEIRDGKLNLASNS